MGDLLTVAYFKIILLTTVISKMHFKRFLHLNQVLHFPKIFAEKCGGTRVGHKSYDKNLVPISTWNIFETFIKQTG